MRRPRPTPATGPAARVVAARVVAALVVGALLAGGCSDPASTLDREGTERAVRRVVGGRIEARVRDVRCPADIARGAGERVTCVALLAGDTGEVRLRVEQADDDGTLEVALLDAVVDPADVADDLRAALVRTFERGFTVTCGDPGPTVVRPGATFTCEAVDETDDRGAGTRRVTVTVTDPAGTLRYGVGDGAPEEPAEPEAPEEGSGG